VAAYLALCWHGAPPPLIEEALAAATDGWSRLWDGPGMMVFSRGPQALRIRTLPGQRGVVIGDLYRSTFRNVGDEVESLVISRAAPLKRVVDDLAGHFWGRYVALIQDDDQVAAFRDPSGAVDLMVWRAGDLQVFASHLPTWLPLALLPENLAVDWAVVGRWVRAFGDIGAVSALTGISAVPPGFVRDGSGAAWPGWSPAVAARHAMPSDAQAAMRDVVDATVRCLTAGEPLIAEVSGGLDSAILAASLARQDPGQVRAWTNYYVEGRRGDERPFARAVAAHLDIPLTEILKPDYAINEAMLAAVADGLRPGVSAKDAVRDADAADRSLALGATRIVTGQGGDMVFFATPTPLLAGDHLREAGPLAWFSPYTAQIAAWCRRSVWRTPGFGGDAALAAHNRGVADHPWMADVGDLSPAKQMQIATLAYKLIVHVEGLRGRVAEVVHPLMAQPVLELCLSIPASVLTLGGRDRGLARAAFAERLPASVRERRSKGELGAYYGQIAAASLPLLRTYLLDGELVRRGLLDRTRLEPWLTREHLIWRGDYPALMSFAVVEAWARHWSARLPNSRI
jgi:asparagine synthase (glutamine-hydrolysing)